MKRQILAPMHAMFESVTEIGTLIQTSIQEKPSTTSGLSDATEQNTTRMGAQMATPGMSIGLNT